jgi:hypothetical protein
MTVQHDFDRQADFPSYRTYAFLPEPTRSPTNPLVAEPLVRKRVHAAFDRHAPGRGLVPAREGAQDLNVAFYVDVKEKVDVTSYGYDYHWEWGATRSVDVYRYQEGTLILDLVDARSGELVWRGWVVAEVSGKPEGSGERIDEAVRKILAGWPPTVK